MSTASQNRFDFGDVGTRPRPPAPAPKASPAPAAKPPGWRRPTVGEHACILCQGFAQFGLGKAWLCRGHLPPDYFTSGARVA